jgi:hypothetical protein
MPADQPAVARRCHGGRINAYNRAATIGRNGSARTADKQPSVMMHMSIPDLVIRDIRARPVGGEDFFNRTDPETSVRESTLGSKPEFVRSLVPRLAALQKVRSLEHSWAHWRRRFDSSSSPSAIEID